METTRPCGCKGIRSCLICERDFGITKAEFCVVKEDKNVYVFCPWCNKAWPGWNTLTYEEHLNHKGTSINFPGIYIQLDFISVEEEERLMNGIDDMPWDLSQSGRRKQNFGPKCNFKKKRLKLGDFKGFPAFSRFVQEKFEHVDILKNYQTVEQCSLEYDPLRGASIDPHIDDCWVWGERIITVNLLADCVLTMTRYQGDPNRYNLQDVKNYWSFSSENEKCHEHGTVDYVNKMEVFHANIANHNSVTSDLNIIVRVPMPRRSLIVMYGLARYLWEHSVLRQDVHNRRVCLAYREFTPPYLVDGVLKDEGRIILDKAKDFWDHK